MEILHLLMITSGVINVICIKWADIIESEGSDGGLQRYSYPWLQALLMFSGQLLCYLLFKIVYFILKRRENESEDNHILTAGNRDFNPFVLFLPSVYDCAVSILLLTALNLTYASSFQMIKATILLFIPLFAGMLINHHVTISQWIGMLILILGTSLVVIADFLVFSHWPDSVPGAKTDSKAVITADMAIIGVQVLHAFKLVVEEKRIKANDIPPLQASGWGGIFGILLVVVVLFPYNYYMDLSDAVKQILNNNTLIILHVVFIFSSAIHSFAGIGIMKNSSSTNRVIMDMTGTIFIWLFASYNAWQHFHYLQLIGFLFIVCGIFVFRNVIFVPFYRWSIGVYLRQRYGGLPSDEVIIQQADTI